MSNREKIDAWHKRMASRMGVGAVVRSSRAARKENINSQYYDSTGIIVEGSYEPGTWQNPFGRVVRWLPSGDLQSCDIYWLEPVEVSDD